MFKFGFTLCVSFIFIYTVNARTKSSETPVQRYEKEISSLINDLERDLNNTKNTIGHIFQKLLVKVKDFRFAKPAQIEVELLEKKNETLKIISEVKGTDAKDCVNYFSALAESGKNASDTSKQCAETELGALEGNITKTIKSINETVNGLEKYREEVHYCRSEEVGAKHFRILKCLRSIKQELSKACSPDFSPTIEAFEKWLNNFDDKMEACASRSLKIFFDQSSSLLNTVNNCIKSKTDAKTTPTLTTQNN